MDDETGQAAATTTTTPILGPMPEFPTLQVYTRDEVNGASPEQLRAMVWQMSESMATLNQRFGEVMGAWQRREATLLEQLQEQQQQQKK